MTKPKKKLHNLTDQELFRYALGSLQFVNDYLKDYDEKRFLNDLMIQDATCYRIKEVGRAIMDITDEIKNKYHSFEWNLYIILNYDLSLDLIWSFYINKSKEDLDSINGLFYHLEQIYFKEYMPEELEEKTKPIQESQWSTDYKYPTKTKNSIWTVKKK